MRKDWHARGGNRGSYKHLIGVKALPGGTNNRWINLFGFFEAHTRFGR